MNNHIYSFEKLLVWQKAREFVKDIYKLTEKFPAEEKFSLTNQIRRAVVSIVANIAEGTSRTSAKDQARFSQIAYSSLMEVLSHLYIAFDLGFINLEELNNHKSITLEISNMLNALQKSQINRYSRINS
jgi:four helix bundle protein